MSVTQCVKLSDGRLNVVERFWMLRGVKTMMSEKEGRKIDIGKEEKEQKGRIAGFNEGRRDSP